MSHQVSTETKPAKVSLFDLRLVLALLFVVYGVILTIMGLLPQPTDAMAKTGDWNVNLWVGITMLVVGALFIIWARTRPLQVSQPPAE